MLNLPKKLKTDSENAAGADPNGSIEDAANNNHTHTTRSQKLRNVRHQLLVKEIQELQESLPTQCKLKWDDTDILHDFRVAISPDEGHWRGGLFNFHVT